MKLLVSRSSRRDESAGSYTARRQAVTHEARRFRAAV